MLLVRFLESSPWVQDTWFTKSDREASMSNIVSIVQGFPPTVWLVVAVGVVIGHQWRMILKAILGTAVLLLLIGIYTIIR